MKRVAGNADPMPNGDMATRKTIPPKIPNVNKIFFINKRTATIICLDAISVTNIAVC